MLRSRVLVPTLVVGSLPLLLARRWRRLLPWSHQVDTPLQRHRAILSNLRSSLRGTGIAADTLDRDLAQVVQTKHGSTRRDRRGPRNISTVVCTPDRVVTCELEVHVLGVEVGTIVPVVHVEPTVDKRFVVVRLCLRILQLVGHSGVFDTGWSVGDRDPWFVRSNEMNGRYMRTKPLVRGGIPN